jgi:hypothetical protein
MFKGAETWSLQRRRFPTAASGLHTVETQPFDLPQSGWTTRFISLSIRRFEKLRTVREFRGSRRFRKASRFQLGTVGDLLLLPHRASRRHLSPHCPALAVHLAPGSPVSRAFRTVERRRWKPATSRGHGVPYPRPRLYVRPWRGSRRPPSADGSIGLKPPRSRLDCRPYPDCRRRLDHLPDPWEGQAWQRVDFEVQKSDH